MEVVRDTDLTHDSPHHTIGRGPTQAAAGNHKHVGEDITGGTLPQGIAPLRSGKEGPFSLTSGNSGTVVVITHNLGRMPASCFVSVEDSGTNTEVIATIKSYNATTLSVQAKDIGTTARTVYLHWLVA